MKRRFRKLTGKHHMLIDGKRRVYGPGCPDGDVIVCEKYELGHALDTFECLDPEPEPELEPEPIIGLRAEHRGHGWWNVRDQATGKVLNDERLTKEEAQAMALGEVETEQDQDGKGMLVGDGEPE